MADLRMLGQSTPTKLMGAIALTGFGFELGVWAWWLFFQG